MEPVKMSPGAPAPAALTLPAIQRAGKAAAGKPERAAGFVVVGCKLPQGLHVPLPPHPVPIKLNGSHSRYARDGVGLTNVKAEHWEAIQERYADAAWLAGGFVFAQATPESAKDQAKDLKGESNGFEPINPDDPNALRGISVTIQKEGAPDQGMGS